MIRELSEREVIEKSLLHEVTAASSGAQPNAVVQLLKGQGFREDRIRAVMWSLIDMRKLTMTPDWLLTLPVNHIASGTVVGQQ